MPLRRLRRTAAPLLLALAAFAPGAASRAGEALDSLLALVPADAGAALSIEDLRGVAQALRSDDAFGRLADSAFVRDWLDSADGSRFRRSIVDLERLLDSKLGTLVDELFGDALVLSLHPAGAGPPGEAGGLLLLRARDRALLHRLIGALNGLERTGGTLETLEERRRGPEAYTARVFREGVKPTDYYRVFDDGVLAWTSSETVLAAVLDRRGGTGPGLVDREDFARMRAALPSDAPLRAYLDPRFVLALGAADGSTPRVEGLPSPLRRHVEGLRFVGLSLGWDRGPVAQLVEDRAGPTAAPGDEPSGVEALLGRVPDGALAVAAAPVDFAALYDLAIEISPELDAAQIARLEALLRGLLMDRDPRTEVLGRLGPAAVGFLEAGPRGPVRGALAIAINGDEDLARAVRSALRTSMALVALDAAERGEDWRIGTTTDDGPSLTTLRRHDSAEPAFAFGLSPDFLVLGNATAPVARLLDVGTPEEPPSRFDRFRSERFADSTSFFYVDLRGVESALSARRAEVARGIAADGSGRTAAEIEADLSRLIGLLKLGDAAYLTSRDEGGGIVRRRFGVVLRAE